MTLERTSYMRGCGKQFKTRQDALDSKRKRAGPSLQARWCFYCKHWHLRAPGKQPPVKAPAPRVRYEQGSVREAVRLILAGEVTVAEAARDAGCGPGYLHRRAWKDARRAVDGRDLGFCANCPAAAVDVHHRIRRGIGGTDDPRILYALANLIALCRACHELAHSRDAEMHVRGMWLETWEQPEAEPAAYLLPAGRRFLFLTPDGKKTGKSPEERAAA